MTGPMMTEQRLERPDCSIYYRCRPSQSGRWVVFLHGAGMDGRMFDQQIYAIPESFGIVSWDARGHGESILRGPFHYGDMLADLDELIRTLGADGLTLVGQSMGGNLAQSFIEGYPGIVDRLVLIDCTDNHGPLSLLERLGLSSTHLILNAYPWRLAVQQSARACNNKPQAIAYVKACLLSMGKKRFIEVMGFWKQALKPDSSYRLPLPTLAFLGDGDQSGNISKALTALARRDTNVRLVTVRNAKHNSNMDQPEKINTELVRFLGA